MQRLQTLTTKAAASIAARSSSLAPAFIISQAWLQIVDALKLVQACKSPHGRSCTGGSALNFVLEQEILSPEEIEELHELRRIRNSIVHVAEADVSLTDALRYSNLANRIIEALRLGA